MNNLFVQSIAFLTSLTLSLSAILWWFQTNVIYMYISRRCSVFLWFFKDFSKNLRNFEKMLVNRVCWKMVVCHICLLLSKLIFCWPFGWCTSRSITILISFIFKGIWNENYILANFLFFNILFNCAKLYYHLIIQLKKITFCSYFVNKSMTYTVSIFILLEQLKIEKILKWSGEVCSVVCLMQR